MEDELQSAMAELDEERTISIVKERLSSGHTALDILESCRRGVEIVGERYNVNTYFLSDLIMSEEILKEVMKVVEPYISVQDSNSGAVRPVVMGTIEGDIHDLGKNIIIYMLRSSGYQVIDLGVDVTPAKFVQAVSETNAPIIGISVLLSFCIGSIKKVVDLLIDAGLRDKVKIVVGGYPVNQTVKEYTGADYYANDVTGALDIYRKILGN